MNAPSISELERAYKDANQRLDTLHTMNFFSMAQSERTAYRKALARAKFVREMALIELDSAWTPPVEWFAKVA